MKPRTPELYAGHMPRTGMVQVAMYDGEQLGPAMVATLTPEEAKTFAYRVVNAADAAETMADALTAGDYRQHPTTPGPTGTVEATPQPAISDAPADEVTP